MPTGGQELKKRLAIAIEFFSDHVEEINRMNVFPVPDGDTGINMVHTLRRAYHEIAALESTSVSIVLQAFAHGSLMGARGNSGTILSQLLKGFADGLDDADSLSSETFAAACAKAVELAYAAVAKPVEGTILTVAREAAESIRRPENSNLDLARSFGVLLRAAERSLRDTPNKLPILRQAGVVDAGAMGLVVFLQGLMADRDLQTVASPNRPHVAPVLRDAEMPLEHTHYGYDVQFLMRGQGLEIDCIRQDLERIGWSVMVVGDAALVKVHIHVNNPAVPLDYAIKTGAELDDIVVENMQVQFNRKVTARDLPGQYVAPQEATSEYTVISVSQGDGLRAIFNDLGCTETVSGGQGRNPSVEDFVEVIGHAPAKPVIVLPNNRNIFLSACQAADLIDDKDVRVLRTETILQGISAMIAFGNAVDGESTVDAIYAEMQTAATQVVSIEITQAIRSGRLNEVDFLLGEFIAIIDGEIRAAANSVEAVILLGLRTINIGSVELATIYYGEDVTESDAIQLIERLSNALTGLQFEAVYGGQSLYPYLIGVE